MAKIRITEDKLTSLIEESVYELLQEAETDERLGHWLGNAFQSIKNGWNNFKNDFRAGRNNARYNNRDYDSYSNYDNGNDFRNFGGREYANYRYNQAVDRNRNSANQWANEFGTSTNSWHDNPNQGTQQNTPAGNQNAQPNAEPAQPSANGNNTGAVSNTTPAQNPDTGAQNTTTQNNATTNTTTNQTTNQTNTKNKQFTQKQKDANKANTLNQLKQQRNNAALFLQQKGFTKRGGQWIYAKDGSNSPAAESQYPDIRNANSRYEYYNNKMNMMERKLKLNNIISESVDKVLRSYNKKMKK